MIDRLKVHYNLVMVKKFNTIYLCVILCSTETRIKDHKYNTYLYLWSLHVCHSSMDHRHCFRTENLVQVIAVTK